MKKLWVITGFFALVLGCSGSALADTLLAKYTLGGQGYVASGCAWRAVTSMTPYGSFTTMVLTCSGNDVASYTTERSPGMLSARAGYKAVTIDGTNTGNTYNYAVYSVTPVCPGVQWTQGNWTDISQASTALSYAQYYKSPACNAPCHYDILATATAYSITCR
jgi:hypothetical protein